MALLSVFAVAGCAARPAGDDDSAAPPAPGTEAGESIGGGEVPDALVERMIADLAAKAGCEPQDVEVVRAQAVTWNDSSLGCAEPGNMYMQMLTEGYQVILRHGGEKYDYRSGGGDGFILCERRDRKDPMR